MSQQPSDSDSPGCLSYLIFAAVAAWVVVISVAVQAGGWFADQILLIEGLSALGGWWLAVSLGQALLLALPVLPLAYFTRAPRLRAAYQAWAVAIAAIAIFGLSRMFFITHVQAATLTQTILAALFAVVLAVVLRARGRAPAGRPAGIAPALILAPVLVLPLLLWGSLGSLFDTFLDLFAGLALGLLAGLLLDALLFKPLSEDPRGPGRRLGFAAITSLVALVILGSGFGFDGSQLQLMLALPPLGLAAAALGLRARRQSRSAWLAIALLVGLVAAAVSMFVDPDELVLVLGNDEIMSWAVRAAALSFGVAILAGLILVIVSALAGRRSAATAGAAAAGSPAAPAVARLLGLAVAIVVWLAAGLVYVLGGQPGLHGDWLYVILRDQADVSSAYNLPDRPQRLRFVYEALVQHADSTQASLRSTFDRLHIAYQPYNLVNSLEVNGGPLLRAYLSTRPEVDRVLDSPHLRPLPHKPPPMTGDLRAPSAPQWNITSIGADRVWRQFGVTGQGIVVGQSDSGVQGDHPALQGGYRGLQAGDDYNWIDPWNNTTHPIDAGGHGTHTLGTAIGRGGIGVAPGAQWFACVNLARNLANPPLYLKCMEFMLAPWPQSGDPLRAGDPTRAAHVINNSWGCPPLEGCDAQVLGPAVAALRAAGIFVVASAGNEGPFCASIREPLALYAGAFSVGAVDEAGHVAVFSSRGPVTVDGSNRHKPDLSAPGDGVLSSLPYNAYGIESGTSMAGPHVVGAVALMWSANPKLIGNIDQTAKILIDTARPYTDPSSSQGHCADNQPPNDEVGHGLLDAYAAVAEAIREK
jgi:hypothetical protein